jgi:hypothetical protein
MEVEVLNPDCNCGSRWCLLDYLLHRARFTVRAVCDRHDRDIWNLF